MKQQMKTNCVALVGHLWSRGGRHNRCLSGGWAASLLLLGGPFFCVDVSRATAATFARTWQLANAASQIREGVIDLDPRTTGNIWEPDDDRSTNFTIRYTDDPPEIKDVFLAPGDTFVGQIAYETRQRIVVSDPLEFDEELVFSSRWVQPPIVALTNPIEMSFRFKGVEGALAGNPVSSTVEMFIPTSPIFGPIGVATLERKMNLTNSSFSFDEVEVRLTNTGTRTWRLLWFDIGLTAPEIVASEPAPHKVILAWGHDAPTKFIAANWFGVTHYLQRPGAMPAYSVPPEEEAAFDSFKEMMRLHVQQTFTDSGVTNVTVVNGAPEPGASVVYFTERIDRGLLGVAFSGGAYPDRFNSHPSGGALVMLHPLDPMSTDLRPSNLDFELNATTVPHEVGHLLGLRHIDPDDDRSVMDYDFVRGLDERFLSGVFPVIEPPGPSGDVLPYTHNPLYHLKRYVDKVSHDELIARGISPGQWDDPAYRLGSFANSFSFSQRLLLYDVHVLETGGDPTTPNLIAHFDEIFSDELSTQMFTTTEGNGLKLFAASVPGGKLDIALARGNPFDDNALVFYSHEGMISAFLQMESDSPAGFETLSEVMILTTVVPEPSSIALVLMSLIFVMQDRVRRSKSFARASGSQLRGRRGLPTTWPTATKYIPPCR